MAQYCPKYRFSIDAGNTRIKLGMFRDDVLMESYASEASGKHDFEALAEILFKSGINFSKGIVSSVISLDEEVMDALTDRYQVIKMDYLVPLPYKNNYQSPESLGTDRIAAIAGLWMLYPGKPGMVINCGTAITYDYMRADGTYIGGAISPGLNMRFKALHTFTSRLPLITSDQAFLDQVSLPAFNGFNTEECMRSGVQLGTLFEIKAVVEAWCKLSKQNEHIILSGGDSKLFVTHLKSSIFALPMEWLQDLVLIGLNSILTFNDV